MTHDELKYGRKKTFCLPQRLKSTFLENFSSGGCLRGTWSEENFSKNVDFSLFKGPVVFCCCSKRSFQVWSKMPKAFNAQSVQCLVSKTYCGDFLFKTFLIFFN